MPVAAWPRISFMSICPQKGGRRKQGLPKCLQNINASLQFPLSLQAPPEPGSSLPSLRGAAAPSAWGDEAISPGPPANVNEHTLKNLLNAFPCPEPSAPGNLCPIPSKPPNFTLKKPSPPTTSLQTLPPSHPSQPPQL